MIRFLGIAALALLLPPLVSCGSSEPGEQQTLVDRATLTVQDMMSQTVSQDPRTQLQRAKAAMVCPRIFKAGFFFGGEGGRCVLLARAGNGTWSYPAFYTIGSGSFGLQIGIEDNEILMLIMTERGLNAVLDNQVKLGGNASIAVATLGAGIQGSTTTAIGADIVAFAASRGLFVGMTLEGSVMAPNTQWNQAYYGQRFSSRQLVMQMQGANPGADPLRDILTGLARGLGAPAGAMPAGSPAGPVTNRRRRDRGAGPPSARTVSQPPPQPYSPPPPNQGYPTPAPSSAGRGPIQERPLPPPAR